MRAKSDSTSAVFLATDQIRATIEPLGASLVGLSFADNELMPAYDRVSAEGRYHGSVVAPWPNRIRDGRYSFSGVDYQLPINEPARNNALHGLSATVPWSVVEVSGDTAHLACRIGNVEGYPWPIGLEALYTLTGTAVVLELQATNRSHGPAPYGAAFHPYFGVPGVDRSQYRLVSPASTVLIPDSHRLPPEGETSVEGGDFDFRDGDCPERQLLDHAFTGFDEGSTAALISPTGIRIEVQGDSSNRWMQLHAPAGADHYGNCVVVEPMTCPPDAFNSNRDIIILQAGETRTLTWTITCGVTGASS